MFFHGTLIILALAIVALAVAGAVVAWAPLRWSARAAVALVALVIGFAPIVVLVIAASQYPGGE